MPEPDITKQVERLLNAVCSENNRSTYYQFLASLVNNAKIRKSCYFFSNVSRTNKEELVKYLIGLGVSNFNIENRCRIHTLALDSFSLIGIINLGFKLLNAEIKIYKDLLRQTQRKDLIKKLLSQKKQEKRFLRKEQNFHSKNEIYIPSQILCLLQ